MEHQRIISRSYKAIGESDGIQHRIIVQESSTSDVNTITDMDEVS